MHSGEGKLTLEELERRLSRLPPVSQTRPTEAVSPERWAYREAACVLSSFDPTTLKPAPGSSASGSALQHLIDDCDTIAVAGGPNRWTLRQPVREATVARVGSREALLRLLEHNAPAAPDHLQREITAHLRGEARPVEEQSLEELTCTLQISQWFGKVLRELPTLEQVRQRLELLRLLAPFQHLIAKGFYGRRSELQKLRDYVGVKDLSLGTEIVQTTKHLLGMRKKPPLLIHGPGGMGKSSLLSKFLLEHASGEERIPFAYLDFDDPSLSPSNPVRLLSEAARQLSLQYPEKAPAFDEFRQACELFTLYRQGPVPPEEKTLAAVRKALRLLRTPAQHTSNLMPPPGALESLLIRSFGQLLSQLAGQKPLLLVFDTFEEVQFRSIDLVQDLDQLLTKLGEAYPDLRTVICGRAPVEQLRAEHLELKELDPDAAQQILHTNGVVEAETARALVEQLGGNPLTLHLASEVARREGTGRKGIEGLKTRRLLFFSAREAVIQGQLYGRILDHIHDPEVRKLAHPGLVVRRITPGVITHVLAGPCALSLATEADAEALFRELQREVSLVFQAPDGSLHHRTDVRRVMQESLRAERPEQVRAIHEAAIRYYAGREEPLSRAEEIYHRLSLGQTHQQLEAVWMPGVEPYLGNALEELPPSAKPYLASKLGIELPRQDWEQAELTDWERRAEARCRDLLSRYLPEQQDLQILLEQGAAPPGHPLFQMLSGLADRVLGVLREREERTPGSPLFELEAQAHALRGTADEGLRVIDQALANAHPFERTCLVSLLFLRARLAAIPRNHALVEESLHEAEQIARRLERPDLVLAAQVRRVEQGNPLRRREHEETLGAFLSTVSDGFLRAHPAVSRWGIGLAAPARPELLTRGLATVGLARIVTRNLYVLLDPSQVPSQIPLEKLNETFMMTDDLQSTLLQALRSGTASGELKQELALTFRVAGLRALVTGRDTPPRSGPAEP